MKTLMTIVAALGLAGLAAVAPARAEVLAVAPGAVVVLPAGDLDETRVAVLFDIGGLATGEGRRIEEAFVEWRLSEASPEATMEFEATAITGTWTEAGLAAGSPVAVAAEPAAYWDIQPVDSERNGAGYVRLDVRDLVAAWAAGEAENFGLLISTPDVTRGEAGRQLADLRLTVRYGFVKP